MPEDRQLVTRLLQEWSGGNKQALDALMPLVHQQLRKLASRCLRGERPDHTLRATALVNEAYLRLVDAKVDWQDRVHFFGSYEYEHQPTTYSYNGPYKSFNVDVNFPTRVHKLMGRLDYEFSTATRLSVRASGYNTLFYALGGTGSATTHPSAIQSP